jgi:hypothetical protein
MSPLFKKSEAKQAEEEAAKAEADRLGALPPAELAVELMPVFGPDGPTRRGPTGGINIVQVLSGFMSKTPHGTRYLRQLDAPVREGLQVLEHAELILRTTRQETTWYKATRLGETALAEGTVQQHIQTPA